MLYSDDGNMCCSRARTVDYRLLESIGGEASIGSPACREESASHHEGEPAGRLSSIMMAPPLAPAPQPEAVHAACGAA